MNLANRLQSSAALRTTPLHPQWLVFRDTRADHAALTRLARGWVLDIGCGDRWVEKVLASDTAYTGLDYPVTVSKGYPGRPDVFADGQSLPFPKCIFDTALLMDVLEHVSDPDRVLRETWRVLKPGGRLVVQVPFLYPLHDEPHDFRRWTSHGLRALLENQGFLVRDVTHHGNPVVSASALLAISLAKGGLDSVNQRHPAVVLLPLMVLAIPVINLLGWLISRLLPASEIMPLGYRIVAVRSE